MMTYQQGNLLAADGEALANMEWPALGERQRTTATTPSGALVRGPGPVRTIPVQIPEPVLKQAEALAARENVPLAQIISLAVAQAIGVWSNESYVALRGRRGSREQFLDALQEVPDVEPPESDRLPEGYRSGP